MEICTYATDTSRKPARSRILCDISQLKIAQAHWRLTGIGWQRGMDRGHTDSAECDSCRAPSLVTQVTEHTLSRRGHSDTTDKIPGITGVTNPEPSQATDMWKSNPKPIKIRSAIQAELKTCSTTISLQMHQQGQGDFRICKGYFQPHHLIKSTSEREHGHCLFISASMRTNSKHFLSNGIYHLYTDLVNFADN